MSPEQNGCHFGRWHFQLHFLEWKWYNSDSNFTEICSQESNWWYDSIGSGNGLAPNRQQAIIWINADPIHWRIYAALGGDELTHPRHGQTWPQFCRQYFKMYFLEINILYFDSFVICSGNDLALSSHILLTCEGEMWVFLCSMFYLHNCIAYSITVTS